MAPAKKVKEFDEDLPRLGPLDYEVESFGPGAFRWPGGEHLLGEHEPHLVEGPDGDWHALMDHHGYEYRSWLCECGFTAMEGREAPDAAPVSALATAADFPPRADLPAALS